MMVVAKIVVAHPGKQNKLVLKYRSKVGNFLITPLPSWQRAFSSLSFKNTVHMTYTHPIFSRRRQTSGCLSHLERTLIRKYLMLHLRLSLSLGLGLSLSLSLSRKIPPPPLLSHDL